MYARLVYVSQAIRPMSQSELNGLVSRCRTNNQKYDITGILLYAAGNFMQLLEGELATIADRYDVIREDHRHKAIQRIVFEFSVDRLMPDWRMGLINLDAEARALDRARLIRLCETARKVSDDGVLTDVVTLLREFRDQLSKTEQPDAKPLTRARTRGTPYRQSA